MSARQHALERIARELAYPLDQALVIGGNYSVAVQHAGVVYVSGQLPRIGTEICLPGRVGDQRTLDEARQAARICGVRVLHALMRQPGGLDSVAQLLQLSVFVHSADDFTRQSEVADAASNLLVAVFGPAGLHSRTSVGVRQLPKNAAVELNLTAALHPV